MQKASIRIMAASVAALGALALTAGTVQAKQTTDTPAASAAQSKDAGGKATKKTRYCVEYKVTGSRIAQRECKTRAEWMKEDGFDPLNPDK